METKQQAINRLKKEGHDKLIVVDVHITDMYHQVSTWQWYVYTKMEDVERFLELCRSYYQDSYEHGGVQEFYVLPPRKGYTMEMYHDDIYEKFKVSVA